MFRLREPIPRPVYLLLAAAGVIVLLLAYTGVSLQRKAENPEDKTIPSWSQLADGVRFSFTPDKRTGEIRIWEDGKATFGRLAAGLGIGIALGVVLGIAMGCYAAVQAVVHFPISFLSRIPPPAIFTILFVVLDFDIAGWMPKWLASVIGRDVLGNLDFFVASIGIGVVSILAQTVFGAVREDVPAELVHKAQTMGASQPEIVWDVIVPTVLPRVIDAARLQIGPAMVFLIAAEYVNADVGIGYQLRFQIRPLNVNVMIVYAVVLGLVGFALDFVVRKLRGLVAPWYGVKS
ncbi:MAG: ABC transporter permease subunit [Planctomycetota bacterium]